MSKSIAPPAIRLRGVRHNNLKNVNLDLPLNQLIVISGLSGSGKSSLAFDTLFAEGQRRYIETFSPYARQFLDRMDKPQADSIEGIPPAIAIEQRNTVRTTRSTVGTMTEICDFMKVLWPHLAQLHCRQCGQPVRKDSPQSIWAAWQRTQATFGAAVEQARENVEVLITFDLPLTEKLSLEDSLALVARQGYQRLLLDERVVRLEEGPERLRRRRPLPSTLTVIQDRLKVTTGSRARFVEACEQAYHFGKGKLALREVLPPATLRPPRWFSNRLHCATCEMEYREPSPSLFSFNHPAGACAACRGFGRVISIDYNLALPDRTKTLAQGVVKPWLTGLSAECQSDLMRMCRHFEIPTNVPFCQLPKKWQEFVIEGEPDYGKDEEHEWPRAWYGVKGYFRWLESRAYKMHVRVLLSRYRAYTPCPQCQGKRLQPEALLYRCPRPAPLGGGSSSELTLADFYALPIREALVFVQQLAAAAAFKSNSPLALALNEARARLAYLHDVGLGYLTLDRPTRSLSGGETERVNLTTCLGTRLVNTLFVLDEPSVGLHPRDTERLVNILRQLQAAGNTVVVVEHEAGVIRAADQIIDLGPGHGATGGSVVFQGTYQHILRSPGSLTGQYLSGRRSVPVPQRRPVSRSPTPKLYRSADLPGASPEAATLNEAPVFYGAQPAAGPSPHPGAFLTLRNATCHNLRNVTISLPLGRLVCVTGVSGSGKTTLVRDLLLPALTAKLEQPTLTAKASARLNEESDQDEETSDSPESSTTMLEGYERLGRVVLVDQSGLGKTPRSNPAVYIGAFDDLRELFAKSDLARQRGLNASAFSFNSRFGQCERCRGAGFEKIEMQFLSDVFIRCPDCQGRRYRSHILEVKTAPEDGALGHHHPRRNSAPAWSIADVLDATVDEVIAFLAGFPGSAPAQRASSSLGLLQEVGLGYLKLGQPINTLSGGESQRLKLVRHLAEATQANAAPLSPSLAPPSQRTGEPRIPAGRGWQHTSGPIRLRSRVEAQAPIKPILFLFDEPTTGLHFDDVRVLVQVFQRLVDAGHSVIVIEHNLDLIKCADWIIDLGPEAGDEGGQVVAFGAPEQVAQCPQSHTGRALRGVLTAVKAPAPRRPVTPLEPDPSEGESVFGSGRTETDPARHRTGWSAP